MQQTVSAREKLFILPERDYLMALEFVELAEELKLTEKTRFATGHKVWKCVYSRKKPSRVIFTIDWTENKWHIKACLFNIEKYKDTVISCSDKITNTIINAYDCYQCNTHCKGGCVFAIGDKTYRKCVGCCFYFSELKDTEWNELRTLIKHEFDCKRLS